MSSENIHLKYIRRLMVALAASGLLNIAFISFFFYWTIKETPPSPYLEKRPLFQETKAQPLVVDKSLVELVNAFRVLSFDQLVSKISNIQAVENGYTQRDIALASLVAFHYFDLDKALVGHEPTDQKRAVVYGLLKNGQPATMTVYPGLSDEQFLAITHFLNTERWPLTSKGLYLQLKKQEEEDSSLSNAFQMTPEFLAIECLFNRSEIAVSKNELQQMVLEGNWELLSDFSEKQKIAQDLSSAKRQSVLQGYIEQKSAMAAFILLKTDYEYALKKLDDRRVVELLDLLRDKSVESEKYATDLLTSPRGDGVWNAAGAKLYLFAGENVPVKNVHHLAMQRFVSAHILVEASNEKSIKKELPAKKVPVAVVISPPKPAPKPVEEKKTVSITSKPIVAAPKPATPSLSSKKKIDRLYIVQEGDSLWKISRKFNIDMEVLRDHNKLQSDALKPGSPLRIP